MIASFRKDESYYKEDLSEWTASVSKGRKYEPYLSEVFFLLGVVLLAFFPNYRITGIAAVLIGIHGLIKYWSFKKRWIRDRVSSRTFGKEMVVEFDNGEINILKPEEDRVTLSIPRVRIIVSKKGYFVCLKESLHLYVPFSSFSPPVSRDEALRFIQADRVAHSDAEGPSR